MVVWSAARRLRLEVRHQVMTPLKIDKPVNGEFNDVVWENCVKLGALKKDYSAAGLCDDGLHCMELGFESTP